MTREIGRVLRTVAFAIEAAGLLGLILARRAAEPRQILGIELRTWMASAVLLGMGLWVVAALLLYAPRGKPREPS